MAILCQASTNRLLIIDEVINIKETHLYFITNMINNKKYIGITSQNPPNNRWIGHKTVAKRKVRNTPLYNSINKYGKDNFKFEVIYSSNDSEYVYFLESFFIEYYNTKDKNEGYNLADGGIIVKGYKIPRDIVKSRALKISGEKHYLYGKKMKKESMEKISNSRKGKKLSDETRAKISLYHKNNSYLKGLKGENHPAFGNKKSKLSIENGKMKHPLRKELLAIDENNGEIIKFNSKSDGARWLISNGKCRSKNINSIISTIGTAIKRNKSYYGYKWELVEEGQTTIS